MKNKSTKISPIIRLQILYKDYVVMLSDKRVGVGVRVYMFWLISCHLKSALCYKSVMQWKIKSENNFWHFPKHFDHTSNKYLFFHKFQFFWFCTEVLSFLVLCNSPWCVTLNAWNFTPTEFLHADPGWNCTQNFWTKSICLLSLILWWQSVLAKYKNIHHCWRN